ncbi:related to lipase/serine esterase [Fusarium fujikuroi IMI 58289]|uniref:Related to lipase/serine esterase n=1 Tax=Gibberella fujikuroi (strain CBS 195.34 / IMI 58289 / NRRL A-6831) TaxID=1279085 RepID=S0E0P5_GIBF5|nr:related to lipase/serine esterase [Fusarium fujikuroi IMI 58289]CCT68361.1 related to lipase/serine esterase [Fusarium fujikuroi IMI 58289]SCN92887.1 related to lipase/serine esterase [Fusarium fujikuroi]
MSKPVVLEDVTGGSAKATHLCVLVHGLWGNPSHMRNVAKALRDEYSEDELYILPAEKNRGNFTYDGIELGGERVCAEIEDKLRSIEEQGGKITKLSIAGYSLGGLVSRYAVGLLYAKGILDDLECMNFTTFASPHLGVRTPLKGWLNNVWNVLGARTLSMSGRQLFTIDKFRDTNRPLLAVLADPDSIFMSGLKKFKRRTLYTNIVNDRSVVHYTSAITKHDPYTDLEKVNLNYLEGYEGVILDPDHPIALRPKLHQDTLLTDYEALKKWVKSIPFMVTVGVIIPIGVVVFLANSAVQTVRSANRIKAHESGEAGLKIEQYRMPLRIKEIREEVEQAYEVLNSSQNQQYLAASDSEDDLAYDVEDRKLLKKERRMSTPGQPTLALTPDQFEMIENLDAAGWRKFPVHIQKHRHSHAAIVVRMDKESFADGWVVLKHFAESEFLM